MNIETLTPEQKAELQEQLNNSQPQEGEGSDYEKRYKDTQASFTKANEEKLALARQLASVNPKSILGMDAKTQAKIIKDEWGYDSLDELKIMKPDVFEDKKVNIENNEDDDTSAQLIKELNLIKLQRNKEGVENAISTYVASNRKVVDTIPNFEQRVNDELKYITSELPPKERVERAVRLISSNKDIDIEAFLALQGKSYNKPLNLATNEESIKKAQNELRAQFWLKSK